MPARSLRDPRQNKNALLAFLLAALAHPVALLKRAAGSLKADHAKLRRDQAAIIDLGSVVLLAGSAIAIIVSLSIVVGFIPSLTNTTTDAIDAINTADFGSAEANNLRGPMTLLLGVTMLLGIVGLVIGVINFRR